MIIKIIVTFILGIISTYFVSIILTVLRCGIPVCKSIVNNLDKPEDERMAAEIVIKKYYISLIVNSLIILAICLIICFVMSEVLIFYFVLVVFYTVIFFGKTGMTQENLLEINNSII